MPEDFLILLARILGIEMTMGGKLAHVHPDLRDQGLSHPAVDARDGVKDLDLL